jgi:hypothetical protein
MDSQNSICPELMATEMGMRQGSSLGVPATTVSAWTRLREPRS